MRKKIIKWLSKRVQIIFRNKRDFKDISIFEFSNFSLISYITIFFVLSFSISFFLSTTILKSFFDPRFLEQKANEELIRLSNSIDSLSLQAEIKDQYIENIMIILNGGENKNNEENLPGKTFKPKDLTNDYSVIDSFFRKEFESTVSSSNLIGNGGVNQDFLLMPPVSSGIVLSVYDPLNNHFGVDFVCKKEEPIKATFDGTVLMSSWTKDSGYVISIIHPNNLKVNNINFGLIYYSKEKYSDDRIKTGFPTKLSLYIDFSLPVIINRMNILQKANLTDISSDIFSSNFEYVGIISNKKD